MSFEDFPWNVSPPATAHAHDLGDLVRVSAVFKNIDGVTPFDPAVVKLSIKNPAGLVTTYVYGTDPLVVKDSTGNYHADIDADASGTWYYRWWSTGTGQAAEESSYTVEAANAV